MIILTQNLLFNLTHVLWACNMVASGWDLKHTAARLRVIGKLE